MDGITSVMILFSQFNELLLKSILAHVEMPSKQDVEECCSLSLYQSEEAKAVCKVQSSSPTLCCCVTATHTQKQSRFFNLGCADIWVLSGLLCVSQVPIQEIPFQASCWTISCSGASFVNLWYPPHRPFNYKTDITFGGSDVQEVMVQHQLNLHSH